MTTKQFYTFEQVKEMVDTIKNKLKTDYDYIIGITRGGLVPATMLSHSMNKPMLTIAYSLRDFPREGRFGDIIDLFNEGKKILFIDDISDEGSTIAGIKRILGEEMSSSERVSFAVLHYNVSGEDVNGMPDYYAKIIDKKDKPVWIVYPWEKADE